MAENKQYITQIQENGKIMISEDVITAIITHAITEVEGVVGINSKAGAELIDMIGGKGRGKGIRVAIRENDEVVIDCNLTIGYGYSVVDVAKAAQETVTNAVESMTGVKVSAINVNICGIVRQ